MGRRVIGPALVALLGEEGVEKVGFGFRKQTAYDKTAEYLRRRASLPINPYTIGTAPIKSGMQRLTKGGIGGMVKGGMGAFFTGMIGLEAFARTSEQLAKNRMARMQWGLG